MPRRLDKSDINSLSNELKTLYEISKVVQEAAVSRDSFESILKSVEEIIDFRSASLFMFSKKTKSLDEICSIGRKVDLINFVEFDMGSGISAWVAQKKRPILLNNLRKSKGGNHTKSFLSVPIVFNNEIIGVINLAHDEPGSFTKEDVNILGIISTIFALLFERVSYQELENETRLAIDELNQQIRSTRNEITKIENVQTGGTASESLCKQIGNPLAIIAGNAQFLIMMMKNSNNSIIRRLKAIDKEAANIMLITNQYLSSGPYGESKFTVSHNDSFKGN